MTAAELLAVVGGDATVEESFGVVTIDVGRDGWLPAVTALRDDPRSAGSFFDWLSAYDDREAGLAVVVRLWSLVTREGVVVRTHVDREGGSLPSLAAVFAGANWHERETYEMFGIAFDGHPNLLPLLLPDGFEGNPLRKEFVLTSRVAKAWPGAKEPGESDRDLERPDGTSRTQRKRIQPPGVPAPGTWGPQA